LSNGQKAGKIFDHPCSVFRMQGQLQQLGHLIDVGFGIPGLHGFGVREPIAAKIPPLASNNKTVVD
jgi:hypothetical protein